MKINKKYGLAVVLAIVVFLVIGSCAAAQAAPARRGCVTPHEWRTMIWDSSPAVIASHFGTSGVVTRINTTALSSDPVNPENKIPFEMMSMSVRYNKCGHWGQHRFVKVAYAGWWAKPTDDKVNYLNRLDQMVLGWAQS